MAAMEFDEVYEEIRGVLVSLVNFLVLIDLILSIDRIPDVWNWLPVRLFLKIYELVKWKHWIKMKLRALNGRNVHVVMD